MCSAYVCRQLTEYISKLLPLGAKGNSSFIGCYSPLVSYSCQLSSNGNFKSYQTLFLLGNITGIQHCHHCAWMFIRINNFCELPENSAEWSSHSGSVTSKRNKSSSDEHFKEEEHSAVLRQNFASARVADLSLELNYETSSYQQLFHQTLTSSSSEVCDQCFPKSGDIRYQTNYSSPPRFVRKNWQ